MDFRETTVTELAAAVRAGTVSARELTVHALDRIEALNPTLNAFVAVDGEAALAAAAAIDGKVAAGEDAGALAGVPIGVKDLEDAAGFVTTHGSAVFADDPPVTRDSELVARLKAAGCVVLGKTNTPELGWMSDTVNAAFGPTYNPWDPMRGPGGSSGGTAAAIAAGMVPVATASDGGGSIRIPSAMCGLSGLKPSLGRVPTGGSEPPDWWNLSTRGPMARRIRDVSYVLDACVGPDPTDLRSLPMPEVSWSAAVAEPRAPRQVLWSPTLGYAPLDPEVRAICEAAVETLAGLGTEVEQVDEVFTEDPVGTWMTLTATYNLRTLEPFRGTDPWERVDPMVRAAVDWAAGLSGLDLVKAEDTAHRLNHRLVQLLHGGKVLLTPTTAAPAPLSGQWPDLDGKQEPNWVRFTYPFNLTRSPAGTVCAGFTASGLPVGLQVVGPPHGDVVVLRVLALLEDALGHQDRLAPV